MFPFETLTPIIPWHFLVSFLVSFRGLRKETLISVSIGQNRENGLCVKESMFLKNA